MSLGFLTVVVFFFEHNILTLQVNAFGYYYLWIKLRSVILRIYKYDVVLQHKVEIFMKCYNWFHYFYR